MKTLLPPGWPRPKGYSNGISVSGRTIFTAGVVGWDKDESFAADTLPGQFAQALRNIVAILAEDGAGPQHLVRLTCYVTSIDAYLAGLAEIGAAWKAIVDEGVVRHSGTTAVASISTIAFGSTRRTTSTNAMVG